MKQADIGDVDTDDVFVGFVSKVQKDECELVAEPDIEVRFEQSCMYFGFRLLLLGVRYFAVKIVGLLDAEMLRVNVALSLIPKVAKPHNS